MITWNNGDRVKVQTGFSFESLILTLNRISSNSGQLELIDKTGARYYTHKNHVDIIIPDGICPDHWRNIMIIGTEDMYEQPKPKPVRKKEIYREKKYRDRKRKERKYK